MKNGLPTTLDELNEIKKSAVKVESLKGQESSDKDGKFVHSYEAKDGSKIVVASYQVTNSMINTSGLGQQIREKRDGEIATISAEEAAHNLIKDYVDNAHLAYKFAKAMKINIPDFQRIDDLENKTYNIVLSFINGETAENYFSNQKNQKHFDDIRYNVGYDYAAFAAMSHSDLHKEQIIIDNHTPFYIDPDEALKRSSLWSNNKAFNIEKAITFTDHYRNDDIVDDDFVINGYFNKVTNNQLIEELSKVCIALEENKDMFVTNHERDIFDKVIERAQGCIEHFKNPQPRKKSIIQNHWAG